IMGYTLKEVTVGKDGFTMGVYSQTIDGIEVIAVVFAGTDQVKDHVTNIKQGAGFVASQYESAAVIANYYKDKGNVTFIGHSLGGGLASLSALISGKHAVTFNAAGLSEGTLDEYQVRGVSESKIDAYIIKGEILNRLLWNVD